MRNIRGKTGEKKEEDDSGTEVHGLFLLEMMTDGAMVPTSLIIYTNKLLLQGAADCISERDPVFY
jgi:hypothetical protein